MSYDLIVCVVCLCNSQLHKNYGCADILDNNTFGTRDVKLTRLKRWFEKKTSKTISLVFYSHTNA